MERLGTIGKSLFVVSYGLMEQGESMALPVLTRGDSFAIDERHEQVVATDNQPGTRDVFIEFELAAKPAHVAGARLLTAPDPLGLDRRLRKQRRESQKKRERRSHR